jgi:hypothetical protein
VTPVGRRNPKLHLRQAPVVSGNYMRLLLLSIVFISCKSLSNETFVQQQYSEFSKNKNTSKINDTIIIKDSNSITKTLYQFTEPDKSLKSIKSWLQNNPSPYGHYFKFTNHELKDYYFLCGDDSCHSYELKANVATEIYSEKGSPLVDFFAPFEINDSLNDYTLLFSTFPRNKVSCSYINHGTLRVLELRKSKLFPFLLEANLICSRSELEKGIVLKVTADELVFSLPGLTHSKEFIDTLRTNTLVHQR